MNQRSTSRLRIALLAGGGSAEREVSLASGRQVAAALAGRGHSVDAFDPAEIEIAEIYWGRYDVCLIALHGGAGEDGRVQAALESLVVPYTGSGPVASRLAMSKSAAKHRFRQRGVPTLPAATFQAADASSEAARRVASLGYPLVVKPDGQGSSLGIGVALDERELAARLAEAFRYDSLALIEPWVDAREFTVAVLGRRALPVLEVVAPGGLFDFQAKYESDATEYRFETGLSGAVAGRLQAIAVDAAAALETSGLVRVDLMLDREGRPWVLEVNTVPGLTSHSLAPKAAARAGFDLAALCEWMLADGLRRFSQTKNPAVEAVP
ncbi:MAG TPA: D-alanine--D-alanine ligase [Pirellulales bacterium]|nr:D-alanine--D-alanine ligase [Pirellulales bacterium]